MLFSREKLINGAQAELSKHELNRNILIKSRQDETKTLLNVRD